MPGEKSCRLLAVAGRGLGDIFERHFLGSCTNWILSFHRGKEEKKRKRERERALKGGRRTPAAPSHDVGEPCIMSWPHYLSTTICPLLPVSPSRFSYLASLPLPSPSSIPIFISLSYKYSFAFLSLPAWTCL